MVVLLMEGNLINLVMLNLKQQGEIQMESQLKKQLRDINQNPKETKAEEKD